MRLQGEAVSRSVESVASEKPSAIACPAIRASAKPMRKGEIAIIRQDS